jgi:hypothetical protein
MEARYHVASSTKVGALHRWLTTLVVVAPVCLAVFYGGLSWAADDSGPADGCAPSLANEGFGARFVDTYKDMLFNYWNDPSNYPAYMKNEDKPVSDPARPATLISGSASAA